MEHHHSFNETKSKALHKIFKYLNPRSTKGLMSKKTTRPDIIKYFETTKATLMEHLSLARSRIHLSHDLWTSPNHIALVGVFGHYMSSGYRVETTLLGLRRLKGPHSGENIAESIVAVVKAYEITDRVGYFVLDNAGSNDTCVSATIEQIGIRDTKEHRRLRCLGHVLNLSAKAILFGDNPEVFEKDIVTAALLKDEKAALRHWRNKGALGKLHNVVVYIGTSALPHSEGKIFWRRHAKEQKG